MTTLSRTCPRLAAVLCTYRRPACVKKMLEAVVAQTKSIDVLVVVDNGRDPTVERICEGLETAFRIEYVAPETNIGPAGAFRVGISRLLDEMGADDLVVLLDDDDPPRQVDTFERLYRIACSRSDDPEFAGVGTRGGRLRHGRVAAVPSVDGPDIQRCDHLHGGFQPMYRVAACRDVAPFDPEFFWGFEELEFGRRLTAAGWRLYVALESGGPVAAKRAGGPLRLESPTWRDYYRHRNLLVVLGRERDWRGICFTVFLRLLAKPLLFLLVRPTVAADNLAMNFRVVIDSVKRPLPDRRDLLLDRA